MKVVCIGSGYVGSVTGASFAALGHPTVIIDIDPQKVELINSGKSPIYEPGLDSLIEQSRRAGLLQAETSYEAVLDADVVFIAVGTPSNENDEADMKYVRSAVRKIGMHLNPNRFTVIVCKSTVPVGTASMAALLVEEASGLTENVHFAMVSNPEFLREGYALEDVFYPDRVVIGTEHTGARALMRELYAHLILQKDYRSMPLGHVIPQHTRLRPVEYFETDTKSSEMIKYVSNAFLAVKISYINEIARLCEALGSNVLEVAKGMGLDSRIGEKFLQVSSGWSGSCFPKDTSELLATSRKYGSRLSIVQAAVDSNQAMHDFCINKLHRRLKSLNGKQIGVLGLTFKPNTDDARKTQASYIIRRLLDMGASVAVHDPKGMEMFRELNPGLSIRYCEGPEEVAIGADAILLLTHWDAYAELDWKLMQPSMKIPYVLDTRNFLKDLQLANLGYHYQGLGV